ncbi:MAG: sporulation initiation factor Spo0A C-terminal domain-containing protein [Lachnospiraceae bacterium]|nr:sporulation initiation factor Spo0A C-terminal domain-containing protein [Lachnospiraceae bacterium]
MRSMRSIFKEIARKEGTTVEAVYQNIQEAIDAGFDNPDPAVQAAWSQIPFSGSRPTPEEVISYYALRVAPHNGILQ